MNIQRHNPAYRFALTKNGGPVGKDFPCSGTINPSLGKFFPTGPPFFRFNDVFSAYAADRSRRENHDSYANRHDPA